MSKVILIIRMCRIRDQRRNVANEVDDGAHTSLWRIFVIHMYAYGIPPRTSRPGRYCISSFISVG